MHVPFDVVTDLLAGLQRRTAGVPANDGQFARSMDQAADALRGPAGNGRSDRSDRPASVGRGPVTGRDDDRSPRGPELVGRRHPAHARGRAVGHDRAPGGPAGDRRRVTTSDDSATRPDAVTTAVADPLVVDEPTGAPGRAQDAVVATTGEPAGTAAADATTAGAGPGAAPAPPGAEVDDVPTSGEADGVPADAAPLADASPLGGAAARPAATGTPDAAGGGPSATDLDGHAREAGVAATATAGAGTSATADALPVPEGAGVVADQETDSAVVASATPVADHADEGAVAPAGRADAPPSEATGAAPARVDGQAAAGTTAAAAAATGSVRTADADPATELQDTAGEAVDGPVAADAGDPAADRVSTRPDGPTAAAHRRAPATVGPVADQAAATAVLRRPTGPSAAASAVTSGTPAVRAAAEPDGDPIGPDRPLAVGAPTTSSASSSAPGPAAASSRLASSSSIAARIEAAVEALRTAPPPREAVIDVDGVRITVRLVGETVHVQTNGQPMDQGQSRGLAQALAGRGLSLAADGGAGEDRQAPEGEGRQGDERRPATDPAPTASARPSADVDALRL